MIPEDNRQLMAYFISQTDEKFDKLDKRLERLDGLLTDLLVQLSKSNYITYSQCSVTQDRMTERLTWLEKRQWVMIGGVSVITFLISLAVSIYK